jgi:hypothetical protein
LVFDDILVLAKSCFEFLIPFQQGLPEFCRELQICNKRNGFIIDCGEINDYFCCIGSGAATLNEVKADVIQKKQKPSNYSKYHRHESSEPVATTMDG